MREQGFPGAAGSGMGRRLPPPNHGWMTRKGLRPVGRQGKSLEQRGNPISALDAGSTANEYQVSDCRGRHKGTSERGICRRAARRPYVGPAGSFSVTCRSVGAWLAMGLLLAAVTTIDGGSAARVTNLSPREVEAGPAFTVNLSFASAFNLSGTDDDDTYVGLAASCNCSSPTISVQLDQRGMDTGSITFAAGAVPAGRHHLFLSSEGPDGPFELEHGLSLVVITPASSTSITKFIPPSIIKSVETTFILEGAECSSRSFLGDTPGP
jgi:hypothetical protein